MPLTKGYTNEIKELSANTILGIAKDEMLSDSITKIGNTANIPLRLYASAIPDSKLNIGANLVQVGDGSGLTVPPADNTLPAFPLSTIDFLTGATTGGTIKRDYNAFTLPTAVAGKFYRVFFVYQAVLNMVNCSFSPQANDVASLQDPGLTSASLDGQVIGYVDLEAITTSTYKTALSVTSIIESAVGGVSRIFRFGSGGGGGSGGVGDTTSIAESLKDQLQDSVYSLLTPVVFKVDKLTYIDGTSVNAAYSYVNKALTFSAISGSYVSINLLDANEFLNVTSAQIQDVGQVDLQVYWKPGFIDSAAVYSVSRDGGANWSVVPMTLNGYGTGSYYGTYKFIAEGSYASLATQAAGALSTGLAGSGNGQAAAQAFTLAAAATLKSQDIYGAKQNNPIGYLYVSWVKASGSLPSTSASDVMAISQAIDVSALATGLNAIVMPETPLPAGNYFVVFTTDAVYKDHWVSSSGSDSVLLTHDATAEGASTYNGSSWADDGTKGFKHTVKGRTLDLRLKVVSSSATSAIDGFGMFYAPSAGNIISTNKKIQVFKFKSATDNLSTFAVTSFILDKDLLKVYWAEAGLCLIYPGFQISGNSIVFPANTFYDVADVDVTLVAQMLEGSSFDGSDTNGALLTDSHLGSTSATLDRSVAGRGIMLRNAAGVLRELRLSADDDIEIIDV
jgi:hypothetical protein